MLRLHFWLLGHPAASAALRFQSEKGHTAAFSRGDPVFDRSQQASVTGRPFKELRWLWSGLENKDLLLKSFGRVHKPFPQAVSQSRLTRQLQALREPPPAASRSGCWYRADRRQHLLPLFSGSSPASARSAPVPSIAGFPPS